jgi:hypothetical protein
MKIRGSAVSTLYERNYAEIDTTEQYWYGRQQASVLVEHGHRIIYVGRMGLFEKFAGVAGRATRRFIGLRHSPRCC